MLFAGDSERCIFCGSNEEVKPTPIDIPNNLQPVCIACYEAFLDACRAQEEE